MRAPPQHIPMHVLQALTTRLIALPVFQRANGKPETQLLEAFCIPVNAGVSAQTPGLTAYLVQRLAKTQAALQILEEPARARLAPKVAILETGTREMLCAVCAPQGAHECKGNNAALDDAQVTSVGACITLVRGMQAHAFAIVAHALQELGAVEPMTSSSAIPFQWGTAWTGAATTTTPTQDLQVGACTRFLDDAEGPFSGIELVIGVDHFDWDSLLSIVWAFVHEFFCHAAQRLPAGSPKRTPCRQSCAFYEGWMDELAFEVLDNTSVTAAPNTFLSKFETALKAAAALFRSHRYAHGPGRSRPVESRQWDVGVDAAVSLLNFFKTMSDGAGSPNSRRAALAGAIGLSFRIQAANPTVGQLDDIVYGCVGALAGALCGDADQDGFLWSHLTKPIDDIGNWINVLQACC
jgi:hypothetical protein